MISVAKMTGREPSATPATIRSDESLHFHPAAELAIDIFEHDDRCVHQNAEVNRAD